MGRRARESVLATDASLAVDRVDAGQALLPNKECVRVRNTLMTRRELWGGVLAVLTFERMLCLGNDECKM